MKNKTLVTVVTIHVNVIAFEWLDQKSPINHPFKGFGPIDLLLPQLIFSESHIWI